jgi:hypothetical protein
MQDWFFSFGMNSDPNNQTWLEKNDKPVWPPYGDTAQTLTVTETLSESGLPYRIGVDDEVGERCNFWRDHADITRN